METNENPYMVSPATQKHHIIEDDTGYPFKNEVREKVRIGFEQWPLNMVGTGLVWMARSLCAIIYYYLLTTDSVSGVTFFDQVRYAWATSGPGSGMVKFIMTAFFVIPFVFLIFMVPDVLARTKLFTLPDNHSPRRRWWHWFVGL